MANSKKNKGILVWILRMAGGTFVLAVLFGIVTQLLMERVGSLTVSLIVLLMVILLGVFFDTVGTAAAAAEKPPLNAKAATRVYGARKGVDLVHNAEKVANFCNDVVGDITGIISGAIAAVIVYNLLFLSDELEFITQIALTAMVAAITVGGKAFGKKIALSKATEIMLLSGKTLTYLETVFSPGKWRTKKK